MQKKGLYQIKMFHASHNGQITPAQWSQCERGGEQMSGGRATRRRERLMHVNSYWWVYQCHKARLGFAGDHKNVHLGLVYCTAGRWQGRPGPSPTYVTTGADLSAPDLCAPEGPRPACFFHAFHATTATPQDFSLALLSTSTGTTSRHCALWGEGRSPPCAVRFTAWLSSPRPRPRRCSASSAWCDLAELKSAGQPVVRAARTAVSAPCRPVSRLNWRRVASSGLEWPEGAGRSRPVKVTTALSGQTEAAMTSGQCHHAPGARPPPLVIWWSLVGHQSTPLDQHGH